MRILSTISLFVLFYSSACFGQSDVSTLAQPTGSAAEAMETPTTTQSVLKLNDLIRKKLSEPINCVYEDAPWNEIEEELEKNFGFNIILTPSARDDSLTEDEPITSDLSGIPLGNALRIMLKNKNATYIVKGGVLQIISMDDEDDPDNFTISMINVRKLLEAISALEEERIGKPRIRPQTNAPKSQPHANQATELVTAESLLIDVVQTTYRNDEWLESGQGIVTIKIIGGFAIVNSNESFSDGLKAFLEELADNLTSND